MGKCYSRELTRTQMAEKAVSEYQLAASPVVYLFYSKGVTVI